jgi:hypothetical protein
MITSFHSRRVGGVKEYSGAGFRRAIQNPKDFLEPGFPANLNLVFFDGSYNFQILCKFKSVFICFSSF